MARTGARGIGMDKQEKLLIRAEVSGSNNRRLPCVRFLEFL